MGFVMNNFMNNFMNKKYKKYNNKSLSYNGETFDSKKEFNRWQELLLLQSAGYIKNIERQVHFELIPNQYMQVEKTLKSGKTKIENKLIERKCEYIADFVYEDKNGNLVVEDTKGFRTKEYIIKRKLMLFIHKIKIQEL